MHASEHRTLIVTTPNGSKEYAVDVLHSHPDGHQVTVTTFDALPAETYPATLVDGDLWMAGHWTIVRASYIPGTKEIHITGLFQPSSATTETEVDD